MIGESNQEAHAVFPAPWLSFLGDPVKSWNACVSLPAKHSDEYLPFENAATSFTTKGASNGNLASGL